MSGTNGTVFQEVTWDALWYRDSSSEETLSILNAAELDAFCEQLVQGGVHAK